MKQWYGKDINTEFLLGKKIAVIGYGNHGRAQSINMQKSGLDVTIGLREDSPTIELAKKDGHIVTTIQKAVKDSDIIHIMIPDLVQAEVYEKTIKPNLRKGMTLSFSHAASISWKWIIPPKDIDVILVAPKTTALGLQQEYNSGKTLFVTHVYQDYTKNASSTTLALAKGIGGENSVMTELSSFEDEVVINWFAEQAVLCGGVSSMIINAFEVLTEAGYNPEIAYFEVLHELKLIMDLIQRYGINGMYRRVSETARYGGLTRGPMIMDKKVKQNMKNVLDDIISGKTQSEMVKQHNTVLNDLMKKLENHEIEKTGIKMREMIYGRE